MKGLLVLACCVCAVWGAMPQSSVGEVAHIIPEVTPSFELMKSPSAMMTTTDGELPTTTLLANPNIVCTYQNPAGSEKWDLTSLKKATGDYKGTDGTYDYKMNVCATSNSGAGCTDKDYSICQFSQAGGTFVASLGSFLIPPTWSVITLPNVPPEPPANGVQYVMTNGDICWIAGRQQVRTVISVFRCSASTEEVIKVEEDQTTCTFTITLKTTAGCQGGPIPPAPTSTGSGGGGTTSAGGISGGTVFLIILICLIPIYIGLGCLYGYKKKAVTGIEAMPNIGFWRDLPGLVKDGCKYTFNMIRSGCKSGHKEQYDAL